MNLSEYQVAALRTSNPFAEHKLRIAVAGMGLAGEAAEVLQVCLEGRVETLVNEIGDVAWYVAEIASCFNIDLGTLSIPDADDGSA